jgi:hypothetical protein
MWKRSVLIRRISWSILTLLMASIACNITDPLGWQSGFDDSWTLVFMDDFSDPLSGWNRASTDSGTSDFNDGSYRILVNQQFSDIWSTPGLYYTDVSIEVDALKVGGERENRFGLICRANHDGYYTFLISSDGFYAVGKFDGSEHTVIGGRAMKVSSIINQGTAQNNIRADCIGDTLTLYINGEMVEQVYDNTFQSGDVGLLAGTYESVGTDILFTNFLVIVP